ncbi:hypothetical protein GPJ56_001307 [Histomonas meleagridis]|uniref:uncharacterized protein n=1 Tax=Histomonas meleagridis TaxID=135588 RepID=UPI003559C850|nr:hypothetical protein GPJ56_001307 [Histomonas meleagridis]KAH0805064.1 hypothetical protein GO595_002009 [Histomonas meleagridis]
MKFPITILPKLMNPGMSNAQYPHCFATTYFHGQQLIAYGSSNNVIIATRSLSIVTSLKGHPEGTMVTSIAWAPYSGRLSSGSTDNRIFIWEPVSSVGWTLSQEIKINSPPVCLSWSHCDHKFCVCSDVVTIYQREDIPDPSTGLCAIHPIWIDPIKATFCSHSRDSRFILVLQANTRTIVIYHKIQQSNSYCRINISQPSPVKNVRWRTTDNIHERCCFFTLGDDMAVRIWTETSVNEKLMFNVVAAIPGCYETVFTAFVTKTTRMVTNNPMIFQQIHRPKSDTYAYGHGHFPLRDRDDREAKLLDQSELEQKHQN